MSLLKEIYEKIEQATIYPSIQTPLEKAHALSEKLGCAIYLKREDLQPVFSFKCRGASNKISRIKEDPLVRQYGVIAASAGNHAQGVALAAKGLGISATIVMPKTTPSIKIDAVKALGGMVILHGDSYDEAYAHALSLGEKNQQPFIPAYDDIDVIAGQGTIAKELDEQVDLKNIGVVYVPVGGGGLFAGIASYLSQTHPHIDVIGVEHEGSACLSEAMKKNERVILAHVDLFADGVAVNRVGEIPFDVAQELLYFSVTVTSDEICAAIQDIFEATRIIAEPSGALALAGLKKHHLSSKMGHEKKDSIAIVSGANMNFDRLQYVVERAKVGAKQELLFGITIPEKVGSFSKFLHQLHNLLGRISISEFNYRLSPHSSVAHVLVGLSFSDACNAMGTLVEEELPKQGYAVVNLTHNEMAKLHIRHMVGGRAPSVTNERIFRFEFPERPGALQTFLDHLGEKWNITLFHYRNHGAACGRVLAGLQIPNNEIDVFQDSVRKLGYFSQEETENDAYTLFL